MAQPPLSQQIRSLERILGYPLFDRTTRGVRLTKVGEYFREGSRNTLTTIHDDMEMERRLGSGQEGVLTVRGVADWVALLRRSAQEEKASRGE